MESRLDSAKINATGTDMLNEVKKMYDALNTVKGLVDGSKSFFDSPAGDELRKKFNTSAEKFQEFQKFLNTYGEFLQAFSGNVVSFENAVKDAVDGIPAL